MRPRFWPRAPLATRRPPRKEAHLKITSGNPLQGVPLRFGRSLVCGPVGLAHDLDRPHGDATASSQSDSPIKTTGGGPLQGSSLCLDRSLCARQTLPVGLAHFDHALLRGLNRLALGLKSKDESGRERGKVLGPGLAVVGARTRVLLDTCDLNSGLPQQRVWLDRPNVIGVCAAVRATILVHRAASAALFTHGVTRVTLPLEASLCTSPSSCDTTSTLTTAVTLQLRTTPRRPPQSPIRTHDRVRVVRRWAAHRHLDSSLQARAFVPRHTIPLHRPTYARQKLYRGPLPQPSERGGLSEDIASTSSTKPMRHPYRKSISIFLACSVSSPSPMASQPLLTALSFLATNLSDPLFGDALGALQALGHAGFLELPTPHGAFLTALAKAALPPRCCRA
ncbi:hypothetical protein BC826DRAFT_1108946 [Russula brevipes]|nr:hypothetical protein BC826DRAFT_1108946 [Russula brevipes]